MQFTTFLAVTIASLVISAIAVRADELSDATAGDRHRPRQRLAAAWFFQRSDLRQRVIAGSSIQYLFAVFAYVVLVGALVTRSIRPIPITDIRLHLTC